MDQDELLDSPIIQRYLHEIVGTEGMQVALSPHDGEVTDEEIAEDLDMEVNTVRRVLIILNEHKLADYRRVRDQESGWLTYYWTYHYERIPSQLEEYMEGLLEMLRKREEYEKRNQFYRCQICQSRHTFDQSVELQFMCPNCSSDLEAEDNSNIPQLIRRRREEIESELQEFDA